MTMTLRELSEEASTGVVRLAMLGLLLLMTVVVIVGLEEGLVVTVAVGVIVGYVVW